jgi:hypothetical protein
MTAIPTDIQKAAEIAVFAFEARIQGGEFEGLDPNGTEARDALKAEIAKAINAERERTAGHFAALKDGCALFLDGRNEHGSHVIEAYPNSMPHEAFNADDGIPAMAEQIITAAEAAGFAVGHCVWASFRWNAPQTGEYGRVEFDGYWEFSHINADLTRLLWGDQEAAPAISPQPSPPKGA